MTYSQPRVGVGVYIRNNGKVLMGKRLSAHGRGTLCPPGGKLEKNESWEDCVRRETREESNLEIGVIKLVGVTNDIWPELDTHYVPLHFVADWESGEATLNEPDKFESWQWFEWDNLPEPLILSARNFLKSGYNPFTI